MSTRLECRHGPLDGDFRACDLSMLVVGFAPLDKCHIAVSVYHPSDVATTKLTGCYVKEPDHLRWVPFP